MVKLTPNLLKLALPAAGQTRLELRDDDEPGLILRVTAAGVRTWSVRYRTSANEQRRKSLGTYPAISLSKARDEARKLKGSVAHGADPVAVERQTKASEITKRLRTVKGLADAYFADAALGLHRPNSKGPKRAGTITEERRIFDRLIEPELGLHLSRTYVAQMYRLSSLVKRVKLSNSPRVPTEAWDPLARPYPMGGTAALFCGSCFPMRSGKT